MKKATFVPFMKMVLCMANMQRATDMIQAFLEAGPFTLEVSYRDNARPAQTFNGLTLKRILFNGGTISIQCMNPKAVTIQDKVRTWFVSTNLQTIPRNGDPENTVAHIDFQGNDGQLTITQREGDFICIWSFQSENPPQPGQTRPQVTEEPSPYDFNNIQPWRW